MADEETTARAVLADMQQRLVRGPHEALGISPEAAPSEIRRAFLQLTKRYHPARFGRMSTEVQKLSNEVFLALRAAHDTLAKPRRTTQNLPPITSRSASHGPGRTRSVTGPPASGARGAGRAGTPAHGVPAVTRSTGSGATGSGATGSGATGSGPRANGDRELAAIHAQLERGEWDQARAALHALAARGGESPKVRALLHYAYGREAQLSRRLDEARVELDTALQLDPELQLAKTALAELFTRRR